MPTQFRLLGVDPLEFWVQCRSHVPHQDICRASLEELLDPRPDFEAWVIAVEKMQEVADFLYLREVPFSQIIIWQTDDRTLHDLHGENATISTFREKVGCFFARVPLDEGWHFFLEQLHRCSQVFFWPQRTRRIDPSWFLDQWVEIGNIQLSDLPLASNEQQHLQDCPECREMLLFHLKERQSWSLKDLCGREGLNRLARSEWLAGERDIDYGNHLRRCEFCRERILQEAAIARESDLIEPDCLNASLASIGLSLP